MDASWLLAYLFCLFRACLSLSLATQNMYMAAMSQNPAAMMLMPYMVQQAQQQQQFPMYSRVALPTDVSSCPVRARDPSSHSCHCNRVSRRRTRCVG